MLLIAATHAWIVLLLMLRLLVPKIKTNATQSFALPCSKLAKTAIIHISNVGKLQMRPLDVAMHAILVKTNPLKTTNALQTCATRFTTHALTFIPRIQVNAVKEQMQQLTAVTIALIVLQA
jgi:hypothetical protein